MQRLPNEVSRRFWKKFRRAQLPPEIPGENFAAPCLLWTGAKDDKGYGIFRAFPGCMGLESGLIRIHRLIYWLMIGPFPKAAQVDHKCRVKHCGEVTHLKLLGIVEHGKKSKADQVADLERLEAEILKEI
jgi:hypothetical protein